MKKLLYLLLALILIPVIALVVVYIYRAELVKYAVNKYVPEMVGIPLNISGVVIEPKTGHFEIKGLNLGNPDGFAKDSLIKLGKIAVDVDMKSLLTDKIVVKSVDIDKPVINFEMKSLTSNNINTFIKNMNERLAAEEEEKEEKIEEAKEKGEAAPVKSFVLDLVNVTSGNVEAAVDVAGKAGSIAVPLPKITLNKVGENKSQDFSEVTVDVLTTILQKSVQAVMSSGKLDLKKVADENVGGIIDKVKEKVGFFGLFGKKEKTEDAAE